jgi:hypothetical protein
LCLRSFVISMKPISSQVIDCWREIFSAVVNASPLLLKVVETEKRSVTKRSKKFGVSGLHRGCVREALYEPRF